ncbi:hypothetical protein GALL_362810 [mine drainage metagenome]|uniref:Uncharacterized protein n=1 Tax=mine drainage metagenome TaxID=410659 RepID=A0A1J5QER6_9ZZZZ
MLDLEAREQRQVVAVALDAADVVGHHVRHELVRLLVDVLGVDQDLADVAGEVIADRAYDQRRFLVDQEGAFLRIAGLVDRAPQLQQVVQVPLQFLDAAADAGGARDQAHPVGMLELIHGLAQFLAVIALDAPAHSAAAGIVRHQHQVTAGQRNEGGQRRALVAALLFFDLDQHFLALTNHVLDPRLRRRNAFLEIAARDFLERQKTVALLAVIDEAGLERGLDAGHDGAVDIALALLAAGLLDVDVEQPLAFDDRDAQLLGLRRVEQHAFHIRTLHPVVADGLRDEQWVTWTRLAQRSRFGRTGERPQAAAPPSAPQCAASPACGARLPCSRPRTRRVPERSGAAVVGGSGGAGHGDRAAGRGPRRKAGSVGILFVLLRRSLFAPARQLRRGRSGARNGGGRAACRAGAGSVSHRAGVAPHAAALRARA